MGKELIHASPEKDMLALTSEGRVSVGRGAELPDASVHDIQRLAQDHGVEIGATVEQYARARELARELD